jgi:hypothetical protein
MPLRTSQESLGIFIAQLIREIGGTPIWTLGSFHRIQNLVPQCGSSAREITNGDVCCHFNLKLGQWCRNRSQSRHCLRATSTNTCVNSKRCRYKILNTTTLNNLDLSAMRACAVGTARKDSEELALAIVAPTNMGIRMHAINLLTMNGVYLSTA